MLLTIPFVIFRRSANGLSFNPDAFFRCPVEKIDKKSYQVDHLMAFFVS